ncbi:C2 domain-containing protein, partial [Mycena pura]
ISRAVIVVLKARNLIDKYFWKQDVFAQVKLNGDAKRTQVDVKGGQTPEWDEEIRVPILKDAHERNRKLEVSCWAKEPRKEENIGTGIVDLTETLKTGEFDDWVRLDVSGVVRGEIYLEMTFFANAPAPAGLPTASGNLQRRPSKLSPADRLARPQQREHLPLLTQPKTQPP